MNKRNIAISQKISNTRLRQDNMTLKKNLRHIVIATKRNLDIQIKMDEIGQVILKCDNFRKMGIDVTDSIKNDFGLTVVSLCLENRFKAMVPPKSSALKTDPLDGKLIFMPEAELAKFFSNVPNPILQGGVEYGNVDYFGMKEYRRVRSQAFVPLFYGDRFLGSLNLGSNERLRYRETDGVDFLKRLAQTMSLAIINLELKGEYVS